MKLNLKRIAYFAIAIAALVILAAIFGGDAPILAVAIAAPPMFGRGAHPMYVPDKDYIWTDPDTGVERQVGVKGVAMTLADAVRYGIVTPEDAGSLSGGRLPVETEEARDARLSSFQSAGTGSLDPNLGSAAGVRPIGEPARVAPAAPSPEAASKAAANQRAATKAHTVAGMRRTSRAGASKSAGTKEGDGSQK